jgi:hypothetical protein
MLWLTMPMTSPAMLNIGPPELPVLMTASVWKNSASGIRRYTVFGAQRALIQPTLNEWLRPYGAPTTITWSPTLTVSESPSVAATAPFGIRSSWSRDRSAAGSEATTRAVTVSPPTSSTVISSIACTTCAAVTTLPSVEITTPEPVSVNLVTPPAPTSWPLALITTTEELTFRNTSPTLWASAGSAPLNATAVSSTIAIVMRMSSLTVFRMCGRLIVGPNRGKRKWVVYPSGAFQGPARGIPSLASGSRRLASRGRHGGRPNSTPTTMRTRARSSARTSPRPVGPGDARSGFGR